MQQHPKCRGKGEVAGEVAEVAAGETTGDVVQRMTKIIHFQLVIYIW